MSARVTIGGREFPVLQLAVERLHWLREWGRYAKTSDPIVRHLVILIDIHTLLSAGTPNIDIDWLNANLTQENAAQLYAELVEQTAAAIARRKAGEAMATNTLN